jgi:Mg-chelatase subunit ChlD
MRNTAIFAVACIFACTGLATAKPELSKREFNDLKKAAKKAAASGDTAAANTKIAELARDDSARAIDVIVVIATKVLATYDAAVTAVARMESDEAVEHLVEKASAGRGKLEARIFFVDVLSARRDDRSVEGLAGAVSGWKKYPQVARAAVAGIGRRRAVRGVDALIDLMEELEGTREESSLLMTQVRDTLLAITGETFEKAVDYRNFWEPRKESFRPVTGRAKPSAGQTGERKRPTFFGTEIKSNRLVFVIDVSGSMQAADPAAPQRGPTGGPRRGPQTGGGPDNGGADPDNKPPVSPSRVRIERAKFQLIHAIDALPANARFTIMAYSGGAAPGPGAGGVGPDDPLPPNFGGFEWLKIWKGKAQLQSASDGNKADAKKWVEALQANGTTFTYNAILHAFTVRDADAIVVLSDGAPTEVDRENGGELTTDKILEKVRAKNRFRRLRIDTFGFGAGAPGGGVAPGGLTLPGPRGGPMGLGAFMQNLARQNGGEYTPIQ